MQIVQEFGNASHIIRGYSETEIRINDARFSRSLIVMPERLDTDWAPRSSDALGAADLERIHALAPEMVILGSARRDLLPDREIQRFFLQRGIGVELMDIGAACRTFNILTSEGRNVACAIVLDGTE